MDSDEEIMYDDCDSGNESSGADDVDFAMVEEPNNHKDRQELDDYPYEILTTEQILQHMNECMREVNVVIEVIEFWPLFQPKSHFVLSVGFYAGSID